MGWRNDATLIWAHTKNMCKNCVKLATFRRVTGTKKATFLTMVTNRGAKANELSAELVQNSVEVEALFAA